MLSKATGIVIKRGKQKEADLSVRLLRESGAILDLYMHGLRASRSRSQLMAEPGTLIRCDYYEKSENGGSFKEGEIVDRFDELKKDYTGTLTLSYLLELCGHAARGDAMPDLYQLLTGALGEMRAFAQLQHESGASAGAAAPPADHRPVSRLFTLQIVAFFKIRLLRILGLLGDSEHCDTCGTPLGEQSGWAVPEMTFRCRRHTEMASRDEAWMAALITRAATTRFGRLRAALDMETAGTDPARIVELWERLNEWLARCLEHYFAAPSTVGPQLYRHLAR